MKVDENGNYIEFRGLTMVSNIAEADRKVWSDLYEFLVKSEVTNKCSYSPLPCDSYHMTTTMLEDEPNTRLICTWEEHINNRLPFLQELSSALHFKNICPIFTCNEILG